ncbi:hypothetical protein J5N97_018126 [Dioscorea zingiberensis]|uniref:Uncharacterized protein n=1 Tax=Dioscorea zingiberensis TaxID=325984 RepID=A0A9D5CML5_9LILI|nr:hypothetical protein J5N97_018126 [Dioscorea zingiberensis]
MGAGGIHDEHGLDGLGWLDLVLLDRRRRDSQGAPDGRHRAISYWMRCECSDTRRAMSQMNREKNQKNTMKEPI